MKLKVRDRTVRLALLKMTLANMDDLFDRHQRTLLDEIIDEAERRIENEQRKQTSEKQSGGRCLT